MKVLLINVVCGIRSTGRICTDLATALEGQGHEVKIAYGRENFPEQFQKYAVKICKDTDVKLHAIRARLFDAAGFGSRKVTEKFVRWIKEYDPDVIHLHNIHGYYINIEVLFNYLKGCRKKIIWNLYDCWTFTGHCAHFDYNECAQWEVGCDNCKFKKEYPKSFISRAKRNYDKKKALFQSIPNMSIIVPSLWLKGLVGKSVLKEYPIYVYPNGIDLDAFKPQDSNLRREHGIVNKFIILGVSSFWNEMKGISFFNKLAERLPELEYQVILVGNTSGIKVSDKIIAVQSTNDINELCKYYTMADVFFNPTLQETQGLTTLEAIACGTPTIVFYSGGAAENINKECGIVVAKGDLDATIEAIEAMKRKKVVFSREHCIEQAHRFEKQKCYEPIIRMYSE